MITIPITTTFIACYAIALVPITGWIGVLRGRLNILRGHGDNRTLEKRIRYHGNLTENAPAMALTLGASEILGAASWALWAAFAAFIIGRVMYYPLYDKEMRALAMSVTQFPAALLALWCLYAIYFADIFTLTGVTQSG